MAEGKTKNLLIVKLYESTKIDIFLLTATYSCKIRSVFTNVGLNILKSEVN